MEGVRVDVRRVDSLPALRAIDCEKAARWVKTKGARRVAKARMADMMGLLRIGLVGVCGDFRGLGSSKLYDVRFLHLTSPA